MMDPSFAGWCAAPTAALRRDDDPADAPARAPAEATLVPAPALMIARLRGLNLQAVRIDWPQVPEPAHAERG